MPATSIVRNAIETPTPNTTQGCILQAACLCLLCVCVCFYAFSLVFVLCATFLFFTTTTLIKEHPRNYYWTLLVAQKDWIVVKASTKIITRSHKTQAR
jgi:uncharacterized membrane protein